MLGDLFKKVTDKAERFVRDPIGETIDHALQPIRDAVTVVGGLIEGELRV